MVREGLTTLLIGRGLVAWGVAQRVTACGHELTGFIDFAKPPYDMLGRKQANAAIAEILERRPHDLLLSVGTPHLLLEDVLRRPRLAALNYHNSLLPNYAGLNATAWAIYNGERQHGITWHHMIGRVDAGNILVQRRFSLTVDATTRSLNVLCSGAAIDSVEEVLSLVAHRRTAGIAQDDDAATYNGGNSKAPNGGTINWCLPAEQIDRLVRACDDGNDGAEFGVASLRTPGGALRVQSSRVINGAGSAGTVLHVQANVLVVACRSGAIELVLDRQAPVQCGDNLRDMGGNLRDMIGTNERTAAPAVPETVERLTGKAVSERVAHMAAQRPAAIAIVESGRETSRGELLARAGDVARVLIGSGLSVEAGVGVLLPAGTDFVIAALGAMQAGGAYVPLDPDTPVERRHVEIAEAGISHVVTSARLALMLAGIDVTVIAIEDVAAAQLGTAMPYLAEDDCAYRIFTSGSTGAPKAVEITHRSLNNLIDHCCAVLPFDQADRMTLLSATTFDASVFDIWPILVAGGTLLIPPADILLDPKALIGWLSETGATCTSVPTAIAERIIFMKWPPHSALRILITGGDVLRRRPPRGLHFVLINSYGPTENTISSMWSIVAPGEGTPLIGRPLTGVTAGIVDATGRRLPDGEIGEIVLGGVQLARGYRGHDELTRQRFELTRIIPANGVTARAISGTSPTTASSSSADVATTRSRF